MINRIVRGAIAGAAGTIGCCHINVGSTCWVGKSVGFRTQNGSNGRENGAKTETRWEIYHAHVY